MIGCGPIQCNVESQKQTKRSLCGWVNGTTHNESCDNTWFTCDLFLCYIQVKPPQTTKHKRASSIDIPLSADIISTTSLPATSPQKETAPTATGTSLTSWLARKIGGATGTGSGSGGTIKSSDKEKSSSASVSQTKFLLLEELWNFYVFNWVESENAQNIFHNFCKC